MNGVKKVIITAPAHPLLAEELSAAGYDVIHEPSISYEQLAAIIGETEGLVVTTRLRIDRHLIDRAQHLKWIGRLGSGMELIDEEYALQKGIHCISTPEGNRNAVAEHTLALVLNLMNRITRSFLEVREGKWLRNENRGIELSGKTVGIIGYGNTGSSFARLLQHFDVEVLVYDKYKTGFGGGYIREAGWSEVLEKADIISLHVPLTEDTYHMADMDFFNALGRRPFFITTCRGGVTDTAALIQAVNDRRISGAALDVLENEKIDRLNEQERQQMQFLTNHPDIIITPHIAGYSVEAYRKMSEILLGKLRYKGLLL